MSRRRISPLRTLRDRALVRAALCFSWLVPKLPLGAVQGLGRVLGTLGGAIPHRRRRRVEEHLRLAFPEKPDAERRRLLRASYRGMAMYFLETLWIRAWRPERDGGRVSVVQPENLAETIRLVRAEGRGFVLFTAHLGSVELMGKWIGEQFGIPVMAVAAPPKIEGLEEPLRRQREQGGLRIVYRGEAGPAALRHLRSGGALITLVDHNLKGAGVAVPFFGHPAHTLLAPARLALQSGAVANTLFGLRAAGGRFLVECGEPMRLPPYPRDKQERFREEARLTREYTARIESVIRRYPDQYLWMHRRWQERPGTPSLPPDCS